MKMKKILSVLVVLSLIMSVFSISAVAAEGKTYTASGELFIGTDHDLNPETFTVEAVADLSKVSALDGLTTNYQSELTSFTVFYVDLDGNTNMVDYVTDPEGFFAVFEKRTADIEFAKEFNADKEASEHLKIKDLSVEAEMAITFENDGLFGVLDYAILINGFSGPAAGDLDLGIDLGFGDDLLSGVKLPVELKIAGNIAEFPSIADFEVLSKPSKVAYTDAEMFDATGLQLQIETTDGANGVFTYNDTNAHAFTSIPTAKENLSTYDSQVITYLNGIEILKTPITVEHQWSAGYVNITTNMYTDGNPGYHAIVCEGCGETHDAHPHTVDENAWTFNNDQTFIKDGTESTECLDCGTVLTRRTQNTADYTTALADLHFIRVILDYINMLFDILGGIMG